MTGETRPPVVVEPVTRHLAMRILGVTETTSREFATLAEARREGRQLSCLRGTVAVAIIGADGAVLCSYDRVDNMWRDLFRGRVSVTADRRSCTCGGVPTCAGDASVLGWLWQCDRCGAPVWTRLGPPAGSGR